MNQKLNPLRGRRLINALGLKIILLDIVLLTLIIVSCVSLGVIISPVVDDYYSKTNSNLKITDSQCTNMSLEDTSYCLNKQVNSFFIYNMSNKGKTLTFEELKSQGGVCLQWANYYVNSLESLGFMGKIIDMQPEDKNKSGHAVALVWNNNLTSYCVIDQRSVIGCGSLA